MDRAKKKHKSHLLNVKLNIRIDIYMYSIDVYSLYMHVYTYVHMCIFSLYLRSYAFRIEQDADLIYNI